VVAKCRTFAEINRTVVEKSRPTGSIIRGRVRNEEGIVRILHSMIVVFIFIKNHIVYGVRARVIIHSEILVIFEKFMDWGMTQSRYSTFLKSQFNVFINYLGRLRIKYLSIIGPKPICLWRLISVRGVRLHRGLEVGRRYMLELSRFLLQKGYIRFGFLGG